MAAQATLIGESVSMPQRRLVYLIRWRLRLAEKKQMAPENQLSSDIAQILAKPEAYLVSVTLT